MSDYTESLRQLLARLGTDPERGLTREEARRRLERDGENRLPGKAPAPLWRRFLLQLRDPMVLILLAAALISFLVALLGRSGSFVDPVIILVIVLLNGALGIHQENRAERALEALRDLSAPTARVVRDGVEERIPAAGLVRGDIVLLEAGDVAPADLRLIEAAGLSCDESILTGESLPAEKHADAKVPRDAPPGDRRNMVFAGCPVLRGRCRGVVTATASGTQVGTVAALLEDQADPSTPLQDRLSSLGKGLGLVALGCCALIFLLGLLRGVAPLELLMTAVSLAVAVVPEGLAAVVTVVLALGVRRMADQGAIVRSLPAVETLGSATVICTDKTGTLTQNRMTVRQVAAAGRDPEEVEGELSPQAMQVLRLGSMCNDGRLEEEEAGEYRQLGDPTETAILVAAAKIGLQRPSLDRQFPRVLEYPFDSDRKRMTTVHRVGGRYLAVVKGGFDVIIPLCHKVDAPRAHAANDRMGEQALRVLAVASRELTGPPEEGDPASLERDLTFIGLIGMIDPPREESREAVEDCRRAGIRTVMITGDHAVTAAAIARELGVLGEGDRVLTGPELQQMSQGQLERQVERVAVYARVSPADKIRVVQAWQSRGAVAAMTGDGVNDAPALRAADIGCAMGVTGTEVAKGAADMVLTDDNFATITQAVRQGRGIYDNIRSTIGFLLGSNLGELLCVLLALVLGWGAPLLAVHLLLINLVTDALPALALGVEPVRGDVMRRRPIPRDQSLFAHGLGVSILLQGVMVCALTLTGYALGAFASLSPYFAPSHAVGRTMAFLVLALCQLVHAFNCRGGQSLRKLGLLSNPAMNRAFLASASIVLLIALIPPLGRVFHVETLSVLHWILVFCLSLLPLLFGECAKLLHALRLRLT